MNRKIISGPELLPLQIQEGLAYDRKKQALEKELEEFLSNKFFDRFGAGIGITRLMRAYQLLKQ
jgi:hypothetical protein